MKTSKIILALLIASAMSLTSCKKSADIEIADNYIILDGEIQPILDATLDATYFGSNLYDIYLYFEKGSVNIQTDKENYEYKVIDLTSYDKTHAGWYWAVSLYDTSGTKQFNSFGNSDQNKTLFTTGTLSVIRTENSITNPTFEIKLNDGIIQDNKFDGKRHTISIYYRGVLRLM